MSRLRKIFIHDALYELYFRLERGLPLVATCYMKLILKGIFAQAQNMYPVKICGLQVMGNHVHALAIAIDPSVFDSFVEYVKRESAHAINRLLGRRRHTVWCRGYDSPIILDSETAIKRFVYLYSNPQSANLVERIEDYPNLNTWSELLADGVTEEECRVVPRDLIPALPKRTMSVAEQKSFANSLHEETNRKAVLRIEPDAWLGCFEDTKDAEPEVFRKEIIRQVRQVEKELAAARKFPVIGRHALCIERMDKEHIPKKHSRKMICLGWNKTIRSRFIGWFKVMSMRAKKAIQHWIETRQLVNLPPGFFVPGGAQFSSINPASIRPF